MGLLFCLILNFNIQYLSQHPVHVTVTNIDYISEKKEFVISMKVYIDDFETIVKHNYQVDLNLGKESELTNSSDYISKYVLENFALITNDIDKTKKRLVFSKKEIVDLSVWFYFTFKCKAKIENLEIKNSLMIDLYNDQTNLLIFTYFGFQQAIEYNNNRLLEKINLK